MDAERLHSPYEDVPAVEEAQSVAASQTIPADGPWVTSVDAQGRTIVTIDPARMMDLVDPAPAHIANGRGNIHTRVVALMGAEEPTEPSGHWGQEQHYEATMQRLFARA